MMIVLLGISALISLVASLVLGVRLLRLASRTRGVPELSLGIGFLVGGFIGLFFVLIGNPGAGSAIPIETSERFFRIGMTLLAIGVSCTYVFVWQTFRPRSGVARVASLLAIVCTVCSVWPLWTMPIQSALVSPIYLAGEAVRLAGMLWGCTEALRYHATMRRRLGLGLADPVVANRFLLWGVAMAAAASTVLVSGFMSSSGLVDPNSWPYLVLAICTAVSPIAQWLAFFPPRSYSAWIANRAAAAS